jgi:glycosyltransferase involved in cell wall biosynthesis
MLSPKKHILILVDWYLPGYKAGGPIQSCANLVNQLKSFYDFSVVCRDTDFGENLPYKGIKSDEWLILEKGVRVFYISSSNLGRSTLKNILNESYDALYLNSMFSFYFTLLPLFLNKYIKKVIVAPRGMLGKGALSIKPFKKNFFLSLAKILGLYSKITWQASSTMEADEIKSVFGKQPQIKIALNLPPLRTLTYVKREKRENHLKLFFLSRISPKKNLLAVFDYINKLKSKFFISLDIIGPIEDKSYWESCEERIKSLIDSHPSVKINYTGSIENKSLLDKLSAYHCMILPTLNENFGHVVLDALTAGCPIILSDQTPWRNLRERKIGWDIPLSKPESFVHAIETMAAMNEKAFNELSLNAFNEGEKFYGNTEIIEQNRKLFD